MREIIGRKPPKQKSIQTYFDAVKPLIDCIGKGEVIIKKSEPVVHYFKRD